MPQKHKSTHACSDRAGAMNVNRQLLRAQLLINTIEYLFTPMQSEYKLFARRGLMTTRTRALMMCVASIGACIPKLTV